MGYVPLMLQVSPLKVESLLGEGLNARVYLATSSSKEFGIQQSYAFKILKRKEDIKHFKKEFSTLSKVQGPHLVRLYGWRKYKGTPGLLLEYIEGVDLDSLVSKQILSFEESNWIYHEVIQGLIELNSHQLFHGDLSPKNIMITVDGHVKLIDFGLARWRTQKIEVTPEFAAPELLNGEAPSLRFDLFALNKIFKRLNLEKSEVSQKEKPNSLAKKVQEALYLNTETQTLELENTTINSRKIKALALVFSLLAFLKPLSASNLTINESKIYLRSQNWMSVKLQGDNKWCFTPCTLKVPHIGSLSIQWKAKGKKGTSLVFIKKEGETLVLNPKTL